MKCLRERLARVLIKWALRLLRYEWAKEDLNSALYDLDKIIEWESK